MWLDENSSREEILKFLEKDPYIFLYRNSDKPWAQSYIDKAANMVAKERPFDFLHFFSDKVWAQPYLDEAAKRAIKQSPFYFLVDFSDKPWVKPYLDEVVKGAARKSPEYFLEHWAARFPQGINWALFALGGNNVSKRKQQ